MCVAAIMKGNKKITAISLYETKFITLSNF